MRNLQNRQAIPILLALAVFLGCACAASTRQTEIRGALVAVDAARDGFLAYDAAQQAKIVDGATSAEDAKAKLAAYRATRDNATGPGGLLTAAYRAIAAAAVANDDPTVTGMLVVVAQLRTLLAPYAGVIK